MDRRRIEQQIRAVVIMYMAELRREDVRHLDGFRLRATEILDGLSAEVTPYPDLAGELDKARATIQGEDAHDR